MKNLEKILGLAAIIALIMKLFLIPFGGVLTILSLSTLACVYYPFGFALFNGIRFRDVFKKISFRGVSKWQIIGGVSLGIGLAVMCMGILFRVQEWPGSGIILIAGLLITFAVLIVALIKYSKTKSEYYTPLFLRIGIIGGLGLILLILPQFAFTKFQFRNHPAYIKAFEDSVNDPQDEELRKIEQLEYNRATMPDELFQRYMDQESRWMDNE